MIRPSLVLVAVAPAAVLVFAAVARADTFAMPGPPTATLDLSTISRDIVVPFAEGQTIRDVNVILSVPHEDGEDLVVRLMHPDGTSITLAESVPGAGFLHTVFDDEAGGPIVGAGPHTGSFTPLVALSAFDGKPSAGTWVIQVMDVAVGGQGELRSCALAFNGMTFVQQKVLDIPLAGTVESSLSVPANVVIADAEVTVDLDHSQILELAVRIAAPGGAQSKLFDGLGAIGGLHGTSFDDEAPTSVDSASMQATGRYQPTQILPEPLGHLDGAATGGKWKLSIFDADPVAGSGVLRGWSVHVVPAGVCVDVASKASTYGNGLAGTLGVPVLVALMDPDLGMFLRVHIGNSAGVTQQAALFIGLQQAFLPGKGGALLLEPVLQMPLVLPPVGANVAASLPADASLCGAHVYLQSLHEDSGAPEGVAFSQGLELIFGS